MSDKKETINTPLNIASCEQITNLIGKCLNYEGQHILGLPDINSDESKFILEMIEKFNKNSDELTKVLGQYYHINFKNAFKLFQNLNFERHSCYCTIDPTIRDFLLNNETCFMYCAILCLTQIERSKLEGIERYKIQNLAECEKMLQRPKNEWAKFLGLNNTDITEMDACTMMTNYMEMLKGLKIKSEKGASRKIAVYFFYTHFSTLFNVNPQNQPHLIPILTVLISIVYEGTEKNKIRDITPYIRKLVLQYSNAQT